MASPTNSAPLEKRTAKKGRPLYTLNASRAFPPAMLARFSHHLTAEARDKPAITSLRLIAVLNVLFKYASARQAARASY